MRKGCILKVIEMDIDNLLICSENDVHEAENGCI